MTRFCPICKQPIKSSQTICSSCESQLDGECFDALMPRCPNCHYPILATEYRCTKCEEEGSPIIHCVARYDGNLGYSVLDSFKFHSDRAMAKVVALYLNRAIEVLDPSEEAILVPVPCSAESLLRNGWDHMVEVCRYLERPSRSLLVSASRPTAQKRLDRKGRIESSEGRFSINPFYDKELESLKDKPVIVVDDVCTTMSTMKSAILTLKGCGFDRVMGASWLLDIVETGGDLDKDMF